jgi:hypothetical protein
MKMASVQELIDAANAQKSPGISAMEGLARGYLNGQQQALERAKTLILLEQNKREQEQMIESRKRMDAQYAADMEKRRAQEKSNAAAKLDGVTPQQKIDDVVTTWERDDKGNLSQRMVISPTKNTDDEKTNLESILWKKVNAGEISIEDAYKLKAQGSPGGIQFVGMQGGEPVLFDRKSKSFETGKLPGQGPLMSGTQTEGQANAKIFGDRAEQANSQLDELSKEVDLSSLKVSAQGKAPNFLKSPQVQMFEQAKRNMINAFLRRESGAVISPAEFENGDQQYFPVLGDSDEVLAQKKLNRETQIAGLKNAAGAVPQSGAPTVKKAVGRWNPKTGKVEMF